MAEIYVNSPLWLRAIMVLTPLMMWGMWLGYCYAVRRWPVSVDTVLDTALEHRIRNIIQAELCREAAERARAERHRGLGE